MAILRLAGKEIVVSFRDFRTFTFMLAFPIALMLILGSALSNAFVSTSTIGDMKLAYRNTAAVPELAAAWDGFAASLVKYGVELVPLEPSDDGPASVSDDRYTAYAEIGNNGIAFYGGVRHAIESSVLQGMLTAFADRYNLAAAAMKESPEMAKTMLADGGGSGGGEGFIRETSLNADKAPSSFDYYAIAVTTMIAFYANIAGGNLMRAEYVQGTANRLLAAPIRKGDIFAGKVLGCTFVNFLCIAAVFLFSKAVFHADWGASPALVLFLLFTLVLLAVSAGLSFGYFFKEKAGGSILFIFTQVASFFGGSYFPLWETKGFVKVLTLLSPMTWANHGLLGLVYAGEIAPALRAIGFNLGFAAVLLAAAALILRRREAL